VRVSVDSPSHRPVPERLTGAARRVIDRTTTGPRWLVALRVVALVAVVGSVLFVGANAATYDPSDEKTLGAGTVEQSATNRTIVSVQGYTFQGETNRKKPARLLAANGSAGTEWQYQSRKGSGAWFFDVDPLPDGNLLVVSPRAGETLVYELDPDTEQRVWSQRLPYEDTHDVDMLSEDELVVGHMRAWNESAGVSDDEVVVYNLTSDRVTWRWRFRNHYPNDTDGGMNADWTHVNDVDVIDEHRLLLSPRNFDQVVILNRTSGEIENRLGSDGDAGTMFEQHNPDYLTGEDGTPTILVADSGNDRVVEYAYRNGSWERTWTVGGDALRWPRDADRLPNGNTLIVDSLNHRVIEITPRGRIVWEYYATWGPYDAERLGTGDESSGPTIRELNATGEYRITNSAGLRPGTGGNNDVPDAIVATFGGTPVAEPARDVAAVWGHYGPWVRPVWLSSWDALWLLLAGLVVLGWAAVEGVRGRHTLAAAVRTRL